MKIDSKILKERYKVIKFIIPFISLAAFSKTQSVIVKLFIQIKPIVRSNAQLSDLFYLLADYQTVICFLVALIFWNFSFTIIYILDHIMKRWEA